jgi:hypothetical protein
VCGAVEADFLSGVYGARGQSSVLQEGADTKCGDGHWWDYIGTEAGDGGVADGLDILGHPLSRQVELDWGKPVALFEIGDG